MKDFHLLPLPILEELRQLRQMKLWFFTNEGLEKTQQAKNRAGRDNSTHVRFNFDKQSLVTENEYEATLKSAPEDNKLSPDQLNKAMPRFIDSIKHAKWPSDVICMLVTFFDKVQRHYKARSKPIGGLFTISQAVYELRNQFHAHLRYHKEALVLALVPSDLDRIREQLCAQRDESTTLFDAYRSAQRDTSPLSLVPKPNSSSFRLIQNLSFPYSKTPIPSINENINAQDYPCTFGTFLNVCFIINKLPPDSKACTRDVADAYRTIPLHHSQWARLVIKLQDDVFALNTQNSFGLASTGGVWGHVADMFADIFRSQGLGPITKWVDDFLFFHLPNQALPQANLYRSQLKPLLTASQSNARCFFLGLRLPDGTLTQYNENFVFPLRSYSISQHAYSTDDIDQLSTSLGLLWKAEKSSPFSPRFTYLGFDWDLKLLIVALQELKRLKYINAITQWQQCCFHTLLQVQSIYGKLLYTIYIVLKGRLYLTEFEKMFPTFSNNPSQPHCPAKATWSDLEWWSRLLSAPRICRPIPSFLPFSPLNAYSDASNLGIAIVIRQAWATFQFLPSFKQRNREIAWAEAVGFELLLHFLQFFPSTINWLQVHCDNTVVAEGWRIGRSRNPFVNAVFKHCHTLLNKNNLQIQLNYIPGTSNPADSLSRLIPLVTEALPILPLPLELKHDIIQTFPPFSISPYSQLCPVHTKLLPTQPNSFDFLRELEKWLPAITVHSSLPSELQAKQKQVLLAAYASSTKMTYGTGLLCYHTFCNTIALPEIYRAPYSTTIIAGFIAFLSGTYSKSAINNFIAAVKAWHHVNLIPCDFDEQIINRMLKGASRVQPLPLPKCEPLTSQQLAQILSFLNVKIPEQATVAACLTTVFYSCSRFFNKVTAFKILRTKTKDNGETVFWACQNLTSDPQFYLLNHLQLNQPQPQQHLFCFKHQNAIVPLTRGIFLRNVSIAAQKAGFHFKDGHSLHIGATMEYLLQGVPFEVVKQLGR
ncbi:reverse transcriptase ribonuclease H [Pyrrhoderma noxium]|uniref:Reverse transcriptase ribonuclease H n=1 Tax=Pyrrhoderma noxium TaxID=2282107 RepID=A0A286U5D9_9AGAM|nr:reverse transcriptase ribonuclease H [Pyrrhoderma noxium]